MAGLMYQFATPQTRCYLSQSHQKNTVQTSYFNTFTFQPKPAPPHMKTLEHYTTFTAQNILLSQLDPTQPALILAYKKAAKKVHPIAVSLPEDFRIIWHIPEDPLLSLPLLPTDPPLFTPGSRLTQECLDSINVNRYNFLWPEEVKLAHHILKTNKHALAWTEAEHGRFRDNYVSPVKIPTVAHTPWIHKNIPIPMGILDNVIDIFKKKIAAGVYEPSDASYRS
jgi:hypothetical protein